MDQETIRLLVTAVGAVIAGLGGALIAGAFNRKNTRATIEAARLEAEKQREAERDLEHARWLRDRKIVAYSKLMKDLDELEQLIRDYYAGDQLSGISDIIQLSRKVDILEVRLLAPAHVVDVVVDALLAFQHRFDILNENEEERKPDSSAFDTVTEAVMQKVSKLGEVIVEDLRTPFRES